MARRNKKIDIKSWLISAQQALDGKTQFPRLESQVVLAYYLQKSKTWILAHPDENIPAACLVDLDQALIRLLDGEPLAYITGSREFFCNSFSVSPATLIPRPETELLVEKAIQWLQIHPGLKLGADIGTGCGCIAISIAKLVNEINFFAVDISHDALKIAKLNVINHQLENRISLANGNLLNFFGRKFDLICANLPYIPTDKLTKLRTIRFEPQVALDGGADGLVFIRELIEKSVIWLQNPGLMLIEFESGQEDKLMKIASSIFPLDRINFDKDLAGKPRLLRITTPSPSPIIRRE